MMPRIQLVTQPGKLQIICKERRQKSFYACFFGLMYTNSFWSHILLIILEVCPQNIQISDTMVCLGIVTPV